MNLEESIVEALGKVKAYDIISIDTKEKSPFYDEMVVASVSSISLKRLKRMALRLELLKVKKRLG